MLEVASRIRVTGSEEPDGDVCVCVCVCAVVRSRMVMCVYARTRSRACAYVCWVVSSADEACNAMRGVGAAPMAASHSQIPPPSTS